MGLRPYEAIEVTWENIDTEKMVLSYLRTKRRNRPPDWRRIPIPAKLIAFLTNEGTTKGRLVNLTPRKASALLKRSHGNRAGGRIDSENIQEGLLISSTYRRRPRRRREPLPGTRVNYPGEALHHEQAVHRASMPLVGRQNVGRKAATGTSQVTGIYGRTMAERFLE